MRLEGGTMDCQNCVFLDLKSGRAYCPFPECIRDLFDPVRVRTKKSIPSSMIRKGETKLEWLRRAQVMRVLGEEDRRRVSAIPVRRGVVVPVSHWEAMKEEDPRMDETERALFPGETYYCAACGAHAYLGKNCRLDRFCPHCGARMRNAGRRKEA